MKLTKCSKNHFYDGDKYTQCPHCSSGTSTESIPASRKAEIAHAISSKGHSQKSEGEHVQRTRSMWEQSQHKAQNMPEIPVNPPKQSNPADSVTGPADFRQKLYVPAEERQSDPPASSLQAAVNAVKQTALRDTDKTVGFYHESSAEPVVGWLVCVVGEYFGDSFQLKTGRNYIGRSLKMDVPIAKDNSVSRERHAEIIYEPKKRKFYILSNEGKGLTYVNEDLLMAPRELQNYDRIQFGNSVFIFSAFCGDFFSWDNYI